MGMDLPYFIVLAGIGAHFGWQMWLFDLAKPDRNFMLFRSNMTVGVLMLVAAMAGTLLSWK
jgi:4-hydroxybenzoate polyprenyltransferase